ncbi:uncharacterized protein [Malus domestica]|uniref:uncharacterized protein n=1 Tax=Malus domestica TaxID=3750 RepID=UPI003974BF39
MFANNMATIQPRSFALKSNDNQKYLRYIHERIENLDGLVQLSEHNVQSEYAKFQMEPADSGNGGLVHIKCCFNNRYLRRANHRQYWIVAGASEREEDTSQWSCTLFKPDFVHSDQEAVIRLIHVQLRHYVTSYTVNDFNQCLFAGFPTPNPGNAIDVYTVVDLEPLLLPRSFALKSNDNKKYLRYIHRRVENLAGLVQLSEENVKSEYAKFQTEPADSGNGGLVHIKCCFNNRYLRRANRRQYWIVAGASEPEEDTSQWSCTLFEPEVVHSDKEAVIRLIHVQLRHYVSSFTVNDFNQCLFAGTKNPKPGNAMDMYTVVDLEPPLLPSPFVLKSNNNDMYLRYMPDQENNIHQILRFSAQDRTSEHAQFQVERANGRDHQTKHYVHIKCLYNGKYLRRMDKYKLLILAAAENRDENTERWTCTLFKPQSVGPTGNNRNNVLCRLRHVATGLYTKPFVDNRSELRLGDEVPDPYGVDVYTAICTFT